MLRTVTIALKSESFGRARLLKEQLQELQDHRRAFYVRRFANARLPDADRWYDLQEAHPMAAAPYSWLPLPLSAPVIPNILIRRRKARQGKQVGLKGGKSSSLPKQNLSGHSDDSSETHAVTVSDEIVQPEIPKAVLKQTDSGSGEDEVTKDGESSSSPEGTLGRSRWRNSTAAKKSVQALFQFLPAGNASGAEGQKKGSDADEEGDSERPRHAHFAGSHGKHNAVGMRYDPEEYQHAKKQLKKAVLECYRWVV